MKILFCDDQPVYLEHMRQLLPLRKNPEDRAIKFSKQAVHPSSKYRKRPCGYKGRRTFHKEEQQGRQGLPRLRHTEYKRGRPPSRRQRQVVQGHRVRCSADRRRSGVESRIKRKEKSCKPSDIFSVRPSGAPQSHSSSRQLSAPAFSGRYMTIATGSSPLQTQ